MESKVLSIAKDLLGAEYGEGHASYSACDNWGMIDLILNRVGIKCVERPPINEWGARRPTSPENYQRVLDGISRLERIERAIDLLPGDIILFRIVKTEPADHVGVLDTDNNLIESAPGLGVRRCWYSRFWRERVVYGYRLKEAK